MKWIKWIVGGLLLIPVLALVALLLVPSERIARLAVARLGEATGREVSLSGDVELSLFPVLGLSAGGLEIADADWAGEGAMLSSARTEIGLDALALLGGEIRITHIEALSPTLRLEQRKDGRANWRFTEGAGDTAAGGSETGQGGRPLSIERLQLTNATLVYAREGEAAMRIDGVDLAMDWPEPQGPAALTAALRPAGAPVTLDVDVENFASFLDGKLERLEARLTGPGGALSLGGRATLQGALAGNLAFEADDLQAFATGLGAAPGTLPPWLGRTGDIKAQMTLTDDGDLALRDLVADIGGNVLRGTFDSSFGATPKIAAKLQAGALDFSALATAPSRGGETAVDEQRSEGWPREDIDAALLAAFDGDIELQAESIRLGALELGATKVALRNERARMVFDLQEVAAYGGSLTGEFVMNNRRGLSVGGDLRARGVEMNPLLEALFGVTRFSGSGDARLSFLGSGQNVEAIMNSLSGSGSFEAGRGTIKGIDLDALLGSVDVKGGSTVFDSLAGSFAIENGVLRNDDLLLTLPNFNATGRGEIGLGAREIDYTVIPRALRVNSGRGLAIPVRIAGPWADPKIRPDVKGALDLNLSEQKKRRAEKARRELEDALREQMGEPVEAPAEALDAPLPAEPASPQQPQPVRQPQPVPERSLEDILKDEIQDRLARELLKIFD